jgi:DNA-binding IclR family transcriptional regulator
MPRAIDILKMISHGHRGVEFNELISQCQLSATDAYRVILLLAKCGLIFYASNGYELNPLGRTVLEAVSILEGAVKGEDIVVFDISHPEQEKVIKFLDSITRN